VFPERDRVIYSRNPLFEVIAQLRFPAILSIGVDIPVKFQEIVRQSFPFVEMIQAVNINVSMGQEVRQVKNYYDFYTADRTVKLTLTDESIALTAKNYRRWEEFSALLVVGLDALLSTYKIPFFTRLGLRYIDFIDKAALALPEVSWTDLIRPSLLGVLSEDLAEKAVVINLLSNFQLRGDDFQCAFNCGLPNFQMLDEEKRKSALNGNVFVLDTDFFSLDGNVNASDSLPNLSRFNKYTRNAFRWAIQDRLHQALEPNPVGPA
jgi:uncharacterized protein (TIGR04255 family)